MTLEEKIAKAVDAGFTDDEIATVLKAQSASEHYSDPMDKPRRGDELTTPDPSPNDVRAQPIANFGPVALKSYGGPVDARMVDPNDPEGKANTDWVKRQIVSQAAGGVAGSALRGVLPIATGVAGRIGGSALQGMAQSGAMGATDTAMQGGSIPDVLRSARNSAVVGGAVGAGTQSVGELLGAAARGIRASKGAKARDLIESYGGHVGAGDSGSGLPEFQGIGKVTDEQIGAQARKSGQELLAANDAKFDAEGRQPYKAAVAQVNQGQGKNLIDVSPLRQKMIEVAYDPSTDPATKSFLLSQVDEIEKNFSHKSGLMIAPESWVNGKTSMLWERSDPAKLAVGAGSVQDAKIADVAAVGQKIRSEGPYADANAAYAKAKDASGDFRQALGLGARPSANEAIDERRVANVLARRGQSTTTAGIQGGDARLNELLAQRPELARTADAPDLLKAKADLQFHLGGKNHGGFLERVGVPAGLAAGLGAAAALGHGPAGVGALVGSEVVNNATPIAGRLLYRPAGAAQNAGQAVQGAMPGINYLTAAAQQKQSNDNAVIQGIFGKGRGRPGPDEKQPQQDAP